MMRYTSYQPELVTPGAGRTRRLYWQGVVSYGLRRAHFETEVAMAAPASFRAAAPGPSRRIADVLGEFIHRRFRCERFARAIGNAGDKVRGHGNRDE